ncbi:hypothetical protein O181_032599 [Austropuccinia psidii MF-1]|uniref:Uncharacterized protein n=1 Tax=Austropuccinia psidii MF-1 TaxID=1389203 RepID=A0A9Q3CX41_9BASI|nr:hypothetical protein [Austropuccinia psidii MF-1]
MHYVPKDPGVVHIWYNIPLCTIFAQKSNREIFTTKSHDSKSSYSCFHKSPCDKDKDKRAKKDHLQPKEEGVRPNDPEAVGFCERNAQATEVAVHNSRISSPLNRNITPTQIEHNVVTTESNLNSDALWLQMSQYSEQTQKQFAELEASHERMKKLTASMDKTVRTLQEEHAQLSKASEKPTKD